MSKKGYISRYLMIVKKLKVKPFSSYEELRSYLDREVEFLQMADDTLNIGFSKRTLQRDLREIRNLFGIDIEYSKSRKGYHIIEDEGGNMNFERMIEAFDLFNSLNLTQDVQQYIFLEKRHPQGTENLHGLMHAIKNRLQIRFSYQKFWEDEISSRLVEPYALKEFNNRWYLIGRNLEDGQTKSFGLDRLSDLQFTSQNFTYPQNLNLEETYQYCFGILSPNDKSPEDIILSFEPDQGKYIKTLPLHATQQILIDSDTELQISLKLFLTEDFIMELLSYGDRVRVIRPQKLAERVKDAHYWAYKVY